VADHLGSIAVVTDGSGNVSERMIYDPGGLQLSPSGATLCGVGTPTTRGFTGEEQMPLDCLVNLNARVYDPVLGRFLTGDPVISSVYDQQALNRYSYVHNNPLSFTDVDGECGPFCVFLINVIADVIFAEVLKPVFEHNPILGDLWIIVDAIDCQICAAEDAGVLAGVKSGSVGKAIEAFVLNYAESEAFKEVGDIKTDLHLSGIAATATSFVLHGAVGGTFSVLQGGQFASGFLSAGVSDLASPYIMENSKGNVALGTAESAVVGGTTSVIGGGSFGNGAITGAFGYLFNACMHGPHGCAILGGGLGLAGGVAVSGACDAATWGACVLGNIPMIGASTAGMAAIGEGIDRAWDRLDTMIANALNSGPIETQYALVAQSDGFYPDVRNGWAYLSAGEVWKYGTTVDPAGRYSGAYLSGLGVSMDVQATGTASQVLIQEKIMLIDYAIGHGSLPPGNSIFK